MLSKRSRRFQKCFCVLSFASKKPSKTQYVWCSGASTLISLISLHSFLPRHVQETFLLCVLPSCHMCATIIQFDTNTICVNSVHVSSKHVLTRPAHASQTPPPSLRHLAAAPPVAIKRPTSTDPPYYLVLCWRSIQIKCGNWEMRSSWSTQFCTSKFEVNRHHVLGTCSRVTGSSGLLRGPNREEKMLVEALSFLHC